MSQTASSFHLLLTEAPFRVEPVPGLSLVALASLGVVVLSGIYLRIQMAGFTLAGPKVKPFKKSNDAVDFAMPRSMNI
jgi:hypothetical protein